LRISNSNRIFNRNDVDFGAVDVLIFTKDYDKAVVREMKQKADAMGTTIEFVSTETTEGEQFNNLSGIGALLRFRVG